VYTRELWLVLADRLMCIRCVNKSKINPGYFVDTPYSGTDEQLYVYMDLIN